MSGFQDGWPWVILLAIGACSEKTSALAQGNEQIAPVGTTPPRGAPAPSPSAPGPEANPAEPAVRSLLEQWAVAQSTNDFAAYDKLYADKFTGIKRAGAFLRQYGRKEWMADRRTMIGPGLRVAVSELELRLSPVGARVEFMQHYHSPRYEDTGRKQMFIVSTPEGPRIAREEMLSSTVQAHAAAGRSLPIHAAESGGVFLMYVPDFAAPRRGARALKPEWLNGYEAESPVNEAALGPDQKAFVGRTFTAYDEKGKPCPATVKSLAMRSAVNAMLDTVEERQGYLSSQDDPGTSRSLPRTVFALGYSFLFGVFDTPCAGARWAAQGSSLRVFARKEPEPPGRDAVRAAFRHLPAYSRLQVPSERYLRGARVVPWDTNAETVAFAEFHADAGLSRSILSVRASRMCDEFNGMLSAVFDTETPGKPVLRGIVEEGDNEVHILAAFDSDGDHELEYVSGPDGLTSDILLLRPTRAGTYTRESVFVVPNTICPC